MNRRAFRYELPSMPTAALDGTTDSGRMAATATASADQIITEHLLNYPRAFNGAAPSA
jgi:hypothetical protein